MRFEKSKRHMGWRYELYTEKFLFPVQLMLDVFGDFVDLEWRAELYTWIDYILVSAFYVADGRKMDREVVSMSATLQKLSAVVEPKVEVVRKATVWDTARKI